MLVNCDIWLNDKEEGNFKLLTNELGGQVYNILLVGEYATPGTLSNRVFTSTVYGKTFRIIRLPELSERIDHTHSIVYDPHERLIKTATVDTIGFLKDVLE